MKIIQIEDALQLGDVTLLNWEHDRYAYMHMWLEDDEQNELYLRFASDCVEQEGLDFVKGVEQGMCFVVNELSSGQGLLCIEDNEGDCSVIKRM